MSAPNLRLAAPFLAALLALVGCSGSVDPSPHVNDPDRLTVLPPDATMFPNYPTTFVISGGTGSYLAASNNQAVLPVAGNVQGRSLTLVPNPVLVDTVVTLTFRDTGTAPLVTVPVTVKPGTVNNNITITPNPLQDASCAPGVCSGGDAEVLVTLSQGGNPLTFRSVDFSVVSGDFRFITTLPGETPERLELTARVLTDHAGKAVVRLRALALAPNQTALLRVTDVATGAFQRTSFLIAQFTGNTPAFFAVPSAFSFVGPYAGACAGAGATELRIFGGTPPYTLVSSFFAFQLVSPSGSLGNPAIVPTNGGYATVRIATQSCATDAPITITDATGRTITVTISNVEGTGTAPAPALGVFPTSVTLTCGTSATLVVSGGSGTYSAGSNHPRVTAVAAGNIVTVTRLASDVGFTPPYGQAAIISVTDGTSLVTATAGVPATCP